jgi:hypothetical protein
MGSTRSGGPEEGGGPGNGLQDVKEQYTFVGMLSIKHTSEQHGLNPHTTGSRCSGNPGEGGGPGNGLQESTA